jgi:protein-S-isoprenylcysteine O-methyltransferase Ste14
LVFIIFNPTDLGNKNIFINLAGLLVSLSGEFIRIFTVGYASRGTSGRESFLKADALNTTGIYSLVRNPLYIGNFLIFSGLIVVFANIWAEIVLAVFLFLQYYFIILCEEDFLKNQYGKDYADYCGKVNRVIPVFKNYRKNRNPFDLKKVVFKESDSVFNMLVMYLLVLAYKEKVYNGSIETQFLFIIIGIALIFSYISVKIIKKYF